MPIGQSLSLTTAARYLLALVFRFGIFDVEVVFIFPWAKELLNFKAAGANLSHSETIAQFFGQVSP